jgi:hypothetical protein
VGTFEGLHSGPVSCACLSGNGALLVTGGLDDCEVSVWKVQRRSRFPGASAIVGSTWQLQHKTTLIGHVSTVTHLAVSHKYGALVSSAEDGTVLLWDLGKGVALRTIPEQGRFPFAVSALQVRERERVGAHGVRVLVRVFRVQSAREHLELCAHLCKTAHACACAVLYA